MCIIGRQVLENFGETIKTFLDGRIITGLSGTLKLIQDDVFGDLSRRWERRLTIDSTDIHATPPWKRSVKLVSMYCQYTYRSNFGNDAENRCSALRYPWK